MHPTANQRASHRELGAHQVECAAGDAGRYIASLLQGSPIFMLKVLAFTIQILVFSFSSVCAQTSSEIQARYGTPVSAYSVSEHIWMTPEFTADGQLCSARLYPKKIDASHNYLMSELSLAEVEAVFDQLAPVTVRGEKKEDYGLVISGGAVVTAFGYEAVHINFVSSLSSWSKVANNRGAKEFPGVRSAQIATITWLHRSCVSELAQYNQRLQRTRR
jgi:hypothetical protein